MSGRETRASMNGREMRAAVDPSVRSPRSFLLWFGVLAPPTAWGAHLLLGDLIFELGCARGVRGGDLFGLSLTAWGYLQTSVLLSISVLGGVLAFLGWRQVPGRRDEVTWVDRARGFAIAGIASGILYSLIIGYGLFALILDPCTPPL